MRKEIIKRQTNTISKLEDSLLSLLENKDLIEIKTRELCSVAKINHQTFYNYYYDHFDLFDDIENKAIEELLSIVYSGFSKEGQSEYLRKISETKYFNRLLKQKNNAMFKDRIKEVVFPTLEKEVAIMSRKEDRKYLSLYIFNGSLSIIEEWIRNGCKDDSEYIASLLYKIAGSIDIYH